MEKMAIMNMLKLKKKISEVNLSKEAKDKALNEFKKLKTMSPMSAEASVIRNYLEWMLDIPWNKFSDENNNINAAEKNSKRRPLWP